MYLIHHTSIHISITSLPPRLTPKADAQLPKIRIEFSLVYKKGDPEATDPFASVKTISSTLPVIPTPPMYLKVAWVNRLDDVIDDVAPALRVGDKENEMVEFMCEVTPYGPDNKAMQMAYTQVNSAGGK